MYLQERTKEYDPPESCASIQLQFQTICDTWHRLLFGTFDQTVALSDTCFSPSLLTSCPKKIKDPKYQISEAFTKVSEYRSCVCVCV
jgi:hypothetical protein